jgi:DNA processing protein
MQGITKLAARDFPSLLREIPEPPEALYLRGSLPPPETKLLAVVGSRRMSRYAEDACAHLIRGLSGYPVAIVSGLALGVDAAAHRAALSAGLPTVAVPGSGIRDDALYPRANLSLAGGILAAGGALMSEFEPDFRARPESFPRRNRIMAGMSHATLIVEAAAKSGTLITARLAADYGRELLVVPHSVFAEGGEGGHIFMKLGAAPVRSAGDILEALGIEERATQEALLLNDAEKRVIALLSEPRPRDEIIRRLGIPVSEANVLLAAMELRGLIAESLGEIRRAV